jgi:hypothetical protein
MMAWQLHYLIDQINVWAIESFRPLVLDHLKGWYSRYVSSRMEILGIQRSLNPNPDIDVDK